MTGADESLLKFPTDLAVKVFGRNESGFRDAVIEIVEAHYGSAYTLAEQQSKQAAYLSLTITVHAESRAQVDALYQALVANELILMAL
jgi:putative lipoic acid-binding regulatory protein